MGKQEFLEKLRMALNGRVSAGIVTDNVKYYEDYINIEIRKGRSEEEILEHLGDPRLIARTIVQTHGGTDEKGRAADVSGEPRTFHKQSSDGYEEGDEREYGRRFFGLHIPNRVFRLTSYLVVFCILALVLILVFSVLSIALPVILIILSVSLVVKLFRDWLN